MMHGNPNIKHSSSSISKVHSAFILIIPISSLVPFPLLKTNWSSSSTSSIFLSIPLLCIFAIIFAVCAIRLTVRLLLHFVACVFFFKAIIVTSVKSLGHSPVSYMVLISFVNIFKPPSPNNLSTSPGTSSSPVAFLFLISLIAFSTSLCKIYGPFSSVSTSSPGSTSRETNAHSVKKCRVIKTFYPSKHQIKSHLPFASITRRCNYSSR